ncbi:MAG: DNA repair exonuclease, partial [Deltaproteobacteria bacterium]|nr:DNA repair exonuclease [Deltaproteobacteria bacterium]
MKFLHTADWQIGMKAVHVGPVGQRVRDERLAAAHRVIQAARRANAEFILVAGDTFEDNGVDRVLIQKVADILAEFGRPVYVIPGNHDPLVPGSVWEHPAWRSHGQVHILMQAEPVQIPGGVLYPCPAREKRSAWNPTAWINTDGTQGVRVGLAHGTIEGVFHEEPDYPIPRDAVARTGLDYLALGHWHSTGLYSVPDGSVRMAYSGTHEPTKFGERDSGNVLLVEIAETGAPPVVTSVRTGGLHWTVIEESLREPGDLARVRAEIEALENCETT